MQLMREFPPNKCKETNATHIWDVQELSSLPQPVTETVGGRQVQVEYNPEVTLRSARDAFALLDRYLKAAHQGK
jgi:hypothetical protein